MEAHGPVNNGSDATVSADRDMVAKEGIRKFNEAVTAAVRNQDAAAKASLWTENTLVFATNAHQVLQLPAKHARGAGPPSGVAGFVHRGFESLVSV